MEKKVFDLNKDFADSGANPKEYEDLFVGLEFEFNYSDVTGSEIAEHFNREFRKTDGKGKKIVKANLSGISGSKAAIEVAVDEDYYKGADLVTDVYNDGSIDYEVVTRPVQLKELRKVKEEVFDYLKDDCNADFFAGGKGGLHMTFLNNHHAERSKFDKAVVSNLVQLSRCYFKEIVCEFPGAGRKTRSLYYRKLPTINERNSPGYDGKYCGIHSKRDGAGNVWAIEIRMPDGTDDWDKIKRQVKFWMAMIRHSSIIAKYGRLDFAQEMFDEQRSWVDNHRGMGQSFVVSNQPRIRELKKIIESSLRWYGYDEGNNANSSEEDKFVKALEMQLAGKNLGEIAKGLGYSVGSTDMVKAILSSGGN